MLREGPERDLDKQRQPLFPQPVLAPLSLLWEDTEPIESATDILLGWATSLSIREQHGVADE